MALRKCPSLVIAPPNFKLYSAYSKAFKDICRGYAPVVEEFSIDECFCDFTRTRLTYPDPIALAHEIKDRIRDELGFTVNVGIEGHSLGGAMASSYAAGHSDELRGLILLVDLFFLDKKHSINIT